MTSLQDLLSSIDPTAKPPSSTSIAKAPAGVVKPAPRQPAPNGTSQGLPLKRKADGPPEGSQVKVIRKDGAAPVARPNGTAPTRPGTTPSAPGSRPTTPSLSIPYRGTAGAGAVNATKTSTPVTKKPVTPTASSPAVASKTPAPAAKPNGAAAAAPAPKKTGYLAILEKAKEIQKAKPPAPPIKHERTKILTKEERLALRAEAKGKKPAAAVAARTKPGDPKVAPADPVRRKSSETGYQGTARPKKPVEITYKGTARPAAGAVPGKAAGYAAAKPKPAQQGRYGGYASWSDEEEEEIEDDEEGYESSDMEAGAWDLDQEEQRALKEAKKEDALALAEEEAMKREKERRKQMLLAQARERAKKRRY